MTINKFYPMHCRASIVAAFFIFALVGCGASPSKEGGKTLADIDVVQKRQARKKPTNKPLEKKSQEEIRDAYRQYVENASTNDISRQQALTRLAQLELDLSDDIASEQRNKAAPDTSHALQRTINLLETTLGDYPNSAGNDKVLYQLAIAYDRAGQYPKSISKLTELVQTYPKSPYYAEARFRMAESAFARGDYIKAEDSYTEVVLTPGSDKFYEKSLFKRGWSRYKQQFYLEAVDDFVESIQYHQFPPDSDMEESERTQFEEYLRALALAFSYEGGKETIRTYFAQINNFDYLFETYDAVSDIYLKQQRFSDAATVLEEYTAYNRQSPNTPLAELKIIAAWKDGGFSSRVFEAIDRFYIDFNPGALFWKHIDNEASAKVSHEKLREHITQISAYHHKLYQQNNKNHDYRQASLWYDRYLTHFSSYARKDHVYSLYAELLLQAKEHEKALGYFILAAYDGKIILDKSAAYSTIVLSADLIDTRSEPKGLSSRLDQHLAFAQRFVELYPTDKRVETIAKSAAERAYRAQRYEQVIDIASAIPLSSSEATRFAVNSIKARAFLELEQYPEAEAVYLSLLESKLMKGKEADTVKNSLALSIYRQAEAAQKDQQIDIALNNFTRIVKLVPESPLAATGLYDAIALSMRGESWNQAIALIEEFKRRYPRHEKTAAITRSLSVAYLKSDQGGKAAQEFERIASFENNIEIKMAALWQAAQLYESKNDIKSAIRAYRDYANTYKTPYEPYVEAMYKLSNLYRQVRDPQRSYFWQAKIRTEDRRATARVKTDRTNFIASTTVLDLARQKKIEFNRRRLVEPIAQNLQLKKTAMQDAVQLFGLASSYGVQEITTEATNSIGQIYKEFSVSLLESERPQNLSVDELEQYEILLEDQAFPFEEKAIEFYETNMTRTREGTYDKWIASSFDELQKLFPVRYQRQGKLHAYQ